MSEVGKVFVKSPVESPDDLLAKGKLDQAGRFLGRAGLATVGGIAGALMPARSFQEWLRNMISMGKLSASAINSKSQLDYLKDRFMLETKGKEQVAQQMSDTRAAKDKASDMASLRGNTPEPSFLQRYGPGGKKVRGQEKQTKLDILNQYQNAYEQGTLPSQQITLTPERKRELDLQAAGNLYRQQKQEEMWERNKQERDFAQKTNKEVGVVSDAVTEDPMADMTAAGQKLLQDKRTGMVDDLLEEPKEPAPVPDIQAIKDSGHLSDDQNDGKNEVQRVENLGDSKTAKDGMDHKAGMEPVSLEEANNTPMPAKQGLVQVASQGPFGVTAPPLSQTSNNPEKRSEDDYDWGRPPVL